MVMKINLVLGEFDKAYKLPKPMKINKPRHKTNFLFDPAAHVSGHKGIERNLEVFKPINPKEIKEESSKRLADSIKSLNEYIKSSDRDIGLRFQLYKKANRDYVMIRDMREGTTLKQIQSDYILELAARLREQSGIVEKLNSKA